MTTLGFYRAKRVVLMLSGLRSLPVIDDGGQVVGMVSRNDLMTAIAGGSPA